MQFLNSYKKNINKLPLFLIVFVFCFIITPFSSFAQKKYTVVLDAGHGGKDGGASRGHYLEKKIALNLVLKVGNILRDDKSINVVYTRKKDVFIELHKRATIANDKNADLFVSIHCNANNSAKPHGAETYVLGLNGNAENLEISKKENAVILLESDYKKNYDYDPNSPESVISLSVLQEENLDASLAFAGFVQNNFKKLKRYDRSVKQANFLVLRETVMPSVLIELGFLSNKEEGAFLNTSSGQRKMADAIAKSIKNYINNLKLNSLQELDENKNLKSIAEVTPKNIVKSTPKKPVVKEKKKVIVKKTPIKKIPKEKKNKTFTVPYIEYKVQVAASKKYISTEPYNFKGLQDVEMKEIGEYYKYYYGSTSIYKSIKPILKEAKEAGHEQAFVVAFKDGEKITINQALKLQ